MQPSKRAAGGGLIAAKIAHQNCSKQAPSVNAGIENLAQNSGFPS
jgi:hypothetical protein